MTSWKVSTYTRWNRSRQGVDDYSRGGETAGSAGDPAGLAKGASGGALAGPLLRGDGRGIGLGAGAPLLDGVVELECIQVQLDRLVGDVIQRTAHHGGDCLQGITVTLG